MLQIRHPLLRYPSNCDPLELAKLAANNAIMTGQDMRVEALDESGDYNLAAYAPAAMEGSILERYRGEYPDASHREPDAEDIRVRKAASMEVQRHGNQLAPGQVLLHGGGPWPALNSYGTRTREIVVHEMLSTTLITGVAQRHAEDHAPYGEIWVITVGPSAATKAIIYPNEGFLKHEREVLLGAGARLAFDRCTVGSHLTVIEAILT